MESFSALDLAINRAQKRKTILFYHDYGNNYDIPSTYDYFVFHKFTTIEHFCEELYEYCKEKSDTESINYDFPNHLSNNDFLIIIDGWKNIYVTNFPQDIDISKHEDDIIKYFHTKSGNYEQ